MTTGRYRGEVVLVDANVLFSRTYRDWLSLLYLRSRGSLFDVMWTEDILAETIYKIREQNQNLSGDVLARIRDKIAGTFPRGRVTNYSVPGTYAGPDPRDAHVHCAAEACGATAVLTENIKDLIPVDADVDDLPYELHRPDEFFVLVDDSAAELVRRVTLEQARHFVRYAGDADLPGALRKAGSPNFAERVRLHLLDLQDEIFAPADV